MSKIRDLIQKVGQMRGEDYPFPDDLEAYLDDFVPNKLLKSETLQEAFSITNSEMEEIYAEAYTHYDNGHFADAANAFRFLVLLDSFQPRFWMGLGASLQMLKRSDKALKAYAVVTLLDSKNPAPHLYASTIYKEMGETKEAQIALASAKELQPC